MQGDVGKQKTSPVAHVTLDGEQVADLARVWTSGRGLEHEPAILGVEGGHGVSARKRCGHGTETEAEEGRRTARCYRTGCCSRWTGALRGSRSGGERALRSFPDRRRRRPYTRSAGACGVFARSEARSNRVGGKGRIRRVFFIKPSAAAGQRRKTYLVAPEEFVPASVLEAIPDVQKLRDPMCPDMIGILFGLIPGERRSKKEQAHGE